MGNILRKRAKSETFWSYPPVFDTKIYLLESPPTSSPSRVSRALSTTKFAIGEHIDKMSVMIDANAFFAFLISARNALESECTFVR